MIGMVSLGGGRKRPVSKRELLRLMPDGSLASWDAWFAFRVREGLRRKKEACSK